MKFFVQTPVGWTYERKYVLDYVLSERLGIEWEWVISEGETVVISSSIDSAELIFPDVFFQMKDGEWLSQGSADKFFVESIDVPSEFGAEVLLSSNVPVLMDGCGNEFKIGESYVSLPLDIFGTIFFLLSRYEEYLIVGRDAHHRVSGSIVRSEGSSDFERPLVDELVELLKFNIKTLWSFVEFKSYEFRQFVSCDVDTPFDISTWSARAVLKRLLGDVLKRHSLRAAFRTIINTYGVWRFGLSRDRYWTFDWIMNACEENDTQCTFFFITQAQHQRDGFGYWGDPRINDLLGNIHRRGHLIGLHGSYESYKSESMLFKQFELLVGQCESYGISQESWGSRQHFLRFEPGLTWGALEGVGIAFDSTLAFADCVGFRAGTCHSFPVFDLRQRRKLKLIERPFVVMDCTLIADRYEAMDMDDAYELCVRIKSICKRYGGEFGLLWHNSSLLENDHRCLYQKILSA